MQNKLVNKVIKINQMKMFGCPFYHISDLFSVRIRVPSRALILHEKGHPRGCPFFVQQRHSVPRRFEVSAPVRAKPRSPEPRATSRAFYTLDKVGTFEDILGIRFTHSLFDRLKSFTIRRVNHPPFFYNTLLKNAILVYNKNVKNAILRIMKNMNFAIFVRMEAYHV